MPKIVSFLPRLKTQRFYDDDKLAQLQLVYDSARQELGIDTDDPRREALAILIFQTAEHTGDTAQLLSRVVNLYRNRA